MDIFRFNAASAKFAACAAGTSVSFVGELKGGAYCLRLSGGEPLVFGFCAVPANPAISMLCGERVRAARLSAPETSFGKALAAHLINGRIAGISRHEGERRLEIEFERTGGKGIQQVRRLVIEIMGRQSGAFITGGDGKLLATARPESAKKNTYRIIAIGSPLLPPPTLAKPSVSLIGRGEFARIIRGAAEKRGNIGIAGLLLSEMTGFTPSCAKILLKAAGIGAETCVSWLIDNDENINALFDLIEAIKNPEGAEKLFGYAETYEVCFLAHASTPESVADGPTADALKRERKLIRLREEAAKAKKWEEILELGNLILAKCNGNGRKRWKSGNTGLAEIIKFAEDNSIYGLISDSVKANEELKQNGLALLKLAGRCRKALPAILERIQKAESEPEPQVAVQRRDPSGISLGKEKQELSSLKKLGIKHKLFHANDGTPIVVGASASSNDALLRKYGSTGYWWFHSREYAGSWVIALSKASPLPGKTLFEAAVVAAWHSKGISDSLAEVCYTQMKNLRKPRGAAAGKVLVKNEKTINVNPLDFKKLFGD